MTNLLIYLAVFLYLLPGHVLAQMMTTTITTTIKDPLAYPLKQYGFILAVSVAGGVVNYFRRARNGDLPTLGIAGLIGELATSAFAGVLMFWGCEFFNAPPLVTAGFVALAGHAGGSLIVWAEVITKRKIEKMAGVTGPSPLGPAEDPK